VFRGDAAVRAHPFLRARPGTSGLAATE
jgi:hypothetical protein